jgi:hypothetical protein
MTRERREYELAKVAYQKTLERLRRAREALPTPSQVREARDAAIWRAYLRGHRNYPGLAKRFHVSVSIVRSVVRNELLGRSFGPPTAREAHYIAAMRLVMDRRQTEMLEEKRRDAEYAAQHGVVFH